MCPVSLRMAAPGSAALIAALISCCACGYAETLDELYAKAKAEKSLVIYAGGITSPWRGNSKANFPA